ncbi:hypothetical protein [Nonomuraea typhae]|uniref:Transmembrane transport protein n=1 Tax=Nonomuraea typhae TaxID=2603600 RepID=A0ABW7Z6Q1_9ACTN
MTEENPRLSAREMIEKLEPSLSRWRRVRAVTALLAGLAGMVFVIALWWSEPGPLPGRTQLGFAMFVVFCLAWAGYGAWLLTRRVPMFVTDRVIAAWIAVAASVATTTLLAVVAVQRGAGLALALVIGGVFTLVSAALAVRAHGRRAALLRRIRELQPPGEQSSP